MTFVSYAQNFEDVILWRALKSVNEGCYIDLGAQDPIVDSVSLAFYERGWRGLHVEPVPFFADKIRAARPDEELIQSAVGRARGPIDFYEIENTGMSTSDRETAQQHKMNGFISKPMKVDCLPLSEVLEPFVGREVHWLKMDIEGMEQHAIESWHPSPVRPWVVLVESTEPNLPEPNHHKWESQLLALGYEFVYFDGLNRFYLSEDHPELAPAFGPGPNVFDNFETAVKRSLGCSLDLANAGLESCNAELTALRQQHAHFEKEKAELNELRRQLGTSQKQNETQDRKIQSLCFEVERLHARVMSAESSLSAIYESTSWKVTIPLRNLKTSFVKILRKQGW